MRTLKEIFEEAIFIQDAVNLTAILGAWRKARIELNDCALGAPDKTRLLDVLYVSKVTSLLSVNATCIGGVEGLLNPRTDTNATDLFSEAYSYARSLVNDSIMQKEG